MLFFYFVLHLSTFDTILSKLPNNTAFQDKVLNFYTLQPYIFENEKILSLILQNRLIKDKNWTGSPAETSPIAIIPFCADQG